MIFKLFTQLTLLTQYLHNNNNQQSVHVAHAYSPSSCEYCSGPHKSVECQVGNSFAPTMEQAQYVGNYKRKQNNPYASHYKPGWRNNPNFSWKNNQHGPPPMLARPPLEKKVSLEEAMAQLVSTRNQFMNKSRMSLQNHSAQLRSLESQISQMANMFAERQKGNLLEVIP